MKTPLALILVSLVATAALAFDLGNDIPLANTTGVQTKPLLALTPGGVVAVWQESGLRSGLMAGGATIDNSRVSTLLDHAPAAAALATLGAESLAVWADAAKIAAIRLDGRGVPIGDPFVVANADASDLAAAAGEERYLIAWPGHFGEVWAVIVARSGSILLPPMPVTTQSTDTIASLHVAPNGDEFAITWTAGRRVFATVLSGSGVPRSFLPVQLTTNGGASDVASNGADFFAVWARSDNSGLGGRVVDANGKVGDEFALTTSPDNVPRVSWDGSAYAVAFARRAERNATTILFTVVQRFAANGAMIESTSTAYQGEPVLTALAGHLAIAYSNGPSIVVRFAEASLPRVRRRAKV